MSFLLGAFKIFILVMVVGSAALYFLQHKLVFHPNTLDQSYKFKFAVPFEEKFITYDEGKVVHGLLFTPPQPKHRILYFHGNAGALDSWGDVGAELAQNLNAEVLIMDYPGFGKSGPDVPSSELGLLGSAQAAYNEFSQSKNSNLPLIIFGRSLGSGVASYITAHNKAAALILETPYLSMAAMASALFPFVPGFLLRYNLDNEKNLKDLNIPVLILHGTADMVVPYEQGKKLASENSKVNFVTIPNGGHNDLSLLPDYWKSVQVFVSGIK